MGLAELIEGIVLHSFEGKPPFGTKTLQFIAQMRSAYGLDLTAADSHRLTETSGDRNERDPLQP